MAFETLAAFALATTILILIPGPSIMLTGAHATQHGARRTMLTVLGAGLACLIHVLIAATGISSLMVLAAEWFEALRWGGVIYLVFMGVQAWRAGGLAKDAETPPTRSGRSLLAEGFAVTLSNPKGIIFVAAFFPQFLDASLPPLPQFTVLSVVYLVIAGGLTAAYAFVADWATAMFKGPRAARLRCRLTGGVLIGGGLLLAAARR